jgi:hypothetical protein
MLLAGKAFDARKDLKNFPLSSRTNSKTYAAHYRSPLQQRKVNARVLCFLKLGIFRWLILKPGGINSQLCKVKLSNEVLYEHYLF